MSGNNAQKLNFGFTLGQAARQRALDHIHLTGKSLPGSIVSAKGSIVQIKFEMGGNYTLPNVTIPMHMPEWQRLPMQKGDMGVVLPSDVTIGHITGLGPKAPPTFLQPGNLSPLVFVPTGSTNFKAVDGDKHVAYGPKGAQIADQNFKSFVGTDSTGGTLAGATPTGTPDPTNITAADYKHTTTQDDTDGIKHTSTKKVSSTAPNVDVNASDSHNINSPTTNVSGLLTAVVAAFGAMSGAGGSPAALLSGAQISGAGGSGLGTNPALAFSYQYLTPLTGTTVNLLQQYITTVIDPAGALAALTINFPSSPPDGLIQIITFTQNITTITLTGGTFAPNVAFTSVPETTTRRSFRFLFVAGTVNKWFRI